ncbi:hypothetical protein [Haloarchaeobius sp. TZWWS8]|uniref:hypothetical protein n=1 Tax=Haloarchaeobius sp. TZWWS8 TaxID=3446121 RepID=UPI003EBEB1EB
MRKFAPLALAALVLFSGCVGVIGDDTASGPTEVDPADADLPPGVTESGLEDPEALVAAHKETLNREGFVLRGHHVFTASSNRDSEEKREYKNESINVTVAPGGTPLLIETRFHDDSAVTSGQIWANESTNFGRLVHGNNSTVVGSKGEPNLKWIQKPTKAPVYELYLTLGNPNYTIEKVVERDGHTFTTLVANETVEVGEDGDTRNHTARFVVDERGIVHEAVIDHENGPDTGHLEYRIVELGPEPPEAPAWTDNVTEWAPESESLVSTTDTSLDRYPTVDRTSVVR